MKDFVVDNSVILSWVFKDENTKKSQELLNKLLKQNAYVPSLWPYELSNALFIAEKNGRIKEADSVSFISSLKDLSLFVENNSYDNITKDILAISREHKITVYDASYIELALRKNLDMASFDKKLNAVCRKIGIKIL